MRLDTELPAKLIKDKAKTIMAIGRAYNDALQHGGLAWSVKDQIQALLSAVFHEQAEAVKACLAAGIETGQDVIIRGMLNAYGVQAVNPLFAIAFDKPNVKAAQLFGATRSMTLLSGQQSHFSISGRLMQLASLNQAQFLNRMQEAITAGQDIVKTAKALQEVSVFTNAALRNRYIRAIDQRISGLSGVIDPAKKAELQQVTRFYRSYADSLTRKGAKGFQHLGIRKATKAFIQNVEQATTYGAVNRALEQWLGHKALYQCKVIARTETARAYVEELRESGQSRPYLKGYRIILSGSHPRQDICDELAKEILFDPAKGVTRASVKLPPWHPNCLCHVVEILEQDYFKTKREELQKDKKEKAAEIAKQKALEVEQKAKAKEATVAALKRNMKHGEMVSYVQQETAGLIPKTHVKEIMSAQKLSEIIHLPPREMAEAVSRLRAEGWRKGGHIDPAFDRAIPITATNSGELARRHFGLLTQAVMDEHGGMLPDRTSTTGQGQLFNGYGKALSQSIRDGSVKVKVSPEALDAFDKVLAEGKHSQTEWGAALGLVKSGQPPTGKLLEWMQNMGTETLDDLLDMMHGKDRTLEILRLLDETAELQKASLRKAGITKVKLYKGLSVPDGNESSVASFFQADKKHFDASPGSNWTTSVERAKARAYRDVSPPPEPVLPAWAKQNLASLNKGELARIHYAAQHGLAELPAADNWDVRLLMRYNKADEMRAKAAQALNEYKPPAAALARPKGFVIATEVDLDDVAFIHNVQGSGGVTLLGNPKLAFTVAEGMEDFNAYVLGNGGAVSALPAGAWERVGGQLGSNEGGKFRGPDGKDYYVKFYRDANQARSEVASAQLCEAMGAKTLNPQIANIDGRVALATQWRDDLVRLSREQLADPSRAQDLARHYMAATVTKNWDVVGQEFDNLLLDRSTNRLVVVDTGGSFKYRAQGGAKDFGGDIDELVSLRSRNRQSGQVFDHVFNADVFAEGEVARGVLDALNDDTIEKALVGAGFDKAERKSLMRSLQVRSEKLREHYNVDFQHYEGYGQHLEVFKTWSRHGLDDLTRDFDGVKGTQTSYKARDDTMKVMGRFKEYINQIHPRADEAIRSIYGSGGWSSNSSSSGGGALKNWARKRFNLEVGYHREAHAETLLRKAVRQDFDHFVSNYGMTSEQLMKVLDAEYEFTQWQLRRLHRYEEYNVIRYVSRSDYARQAKNLKGNKDETGAEGLYTANAVASTAATEGNYTSSVKLLLKARNEHFVKTWRQGRDYMSYYDRENEYIVLGIPLRYERLSYRY
ncbi:MAG: NAD(+)--dinitrogen-reductase ADP-D-ribosyltransferase [Deltaproteobacteria bacterium]|nr:NAD(+)--dinitrogen-reductase ADP-D-ribosyltransferase [Deltaproteobacteria bacterium]